MSLNKNQSMAADTELQPEQKPQELFEINELRKQKKISRAIFAGVCSVNGWRPGKTITEEEFLSEVAKFTKSPINGRPLDNEKESEAKE